MLFGYVYFPRIVVVLVLDFFGRGKRADCQQRSKIENEDEDDWRGAYTALNTYPFGGDTG